MRTHLGHRRPTKPHAADSWPAARDDARMLAIEIGHGQPHVALDAMAFGFVLQPREVAYRYVPAWLTAFDHGRWASPSASRVFVTDRRLVCRLSSGPLACLLWRGVAGLHVDLPRGRLTLDYADGAPVQLFGREAPTIAVAAISFIYGPRALTTHPGIEALRY